SSAAKAARNAVRFSISLPSTAAGSGIPPMRVDRLAGPHGAGFARRVVADGEDEIHGWRARDREHIPALGMHVGRRVAEPRQKVDGVGMHRALGMAAGAEALET